jgi:hypothetical protein
MPPRNPPPTLEQATPKKRAARYVIEIRDAAGVSLLLTSVDWTESERNLAMSAVLKLVGFKSAAPVKRQGNKPRSGDQASKSRRSEL